MTTKEIPSIFVTEPKCLILDVRTTEEYRGGASSRGPFLAERIHRRGSARAPPRPQRLPSALLPQRQPQPAGRPKIGADGLYQRG